MARRQPTPPEPEDTKSWTKKPEVDDPGVDETASSIEDAADGIASEPKIDPAEFERGFKAGRRVGENSADLSTYTQPLYGMTARQNLDESRRHKIILEDWQVTLILHSLGVGERQQRDAVNTFHPGTRRNLEQVLNRYSATIADLNVQAGFAYDEELPALAKVTAKSALVP